MNKYKKMLVANRGEIAVRIIKALKELDIETIAVYSTADADALHTKLADQNICIGSPNSLDSYLNTYKILSAASMLGADSIHPGIGFLAENGSFSALCKESQIDFIGPESHIIENMGNKYMAKQIAHSCGIPIIKGTSKTVLTLDECCSSIEEVGYPALLKATCGGGGKGIRVVFGPEELENSYNLCVREAKAAFNNTELIIEQFIGNAKHVEVQILGDKFGNIIHLGDRECTIQRSNQKIIEEARCMNIDDIIRQKLYADAIKIGKKIGYVGPGTVEFLVQDSGDYYFLEMNTRLQVEHTITELVTGVDLVKEQINVFSGKALSLKQKDIHFNNYAMQCRILAENVSGSFSPSFGKITAWNMPGGPGVRIDSGYRCNDSVSPYYDSLLAKICCLAPNKEAAIKKMRVCLEEAEVKGVYTNIEFLNFILGEEEIILGNYTEKFTPEAILKFKERMSA